MRATLLAACLLMAAPALAQKPPPLGGPDNRGRGSDHARPDAARPDTARPFDDGRPFAAVPPGKPPPLGTGDPDRRRPRDNDGSPDGELPGSRERAASSGTGFLVAEGRVLTNNHVINDCGRVVARNAAGVRVPAQVQAADRQRDLALLRVPATLGPALTFREAPPVRRGENVITYGFPLSGLLSSGPSLTTGNISALAGIRDNPGNFQISAAVQPGNSGGPLFDSQGNVIGVVVSKLNASRVAEMTGGDIPQNVNFAVKGTEALAFLRQNGVTPRTATSAGAERRADEVDSVANPSTLYLQCFR